MTDQNPAVRGMVISALRFTFSDTDEGYDEYLKPIVIGMLKTMLNETDLENRRIALTTLNSAAQNKPNLILPHLGQLLPLLIKETEIKPELIREVQMGPFKHKVDDGLEIRRSAYETLHALLEPAFPLLDIGKFYDRVIAGVGDEHDIRLLCTLILVKLIPLAPTETHARLDALAEPFRAVLSIKLKDSAVKQDFEKANEESKDVVKVSLLLARHFPDESAHASRPWGQYWDWVRKEHVALVKSAEDDARER